MTDQTQAETPKLIPEDIKAMSPDELIRTHRQLADYFTAEQKRLRDFLAPHVERQDFIERELHGRLLELNKGQTGKRANISTDAGTAYLSTIVTPKIVDKTQFLDWVLEDWDKRGDMLQIGAPQKDAFNSWTDEHKGNPPHVITDSFTRVNIRKS